MRKKVAIGMSGGVDSATAAYLLKEQGYDVVGITMKLIDGEKTDSAICDAKDVCNTLCINHYVIDLTNEFKKCVINNFVDSYNNGVTPNPCCVCNKYFKFGLFFEEAKKLGCDYISTGHYARICDGKLYRANVLEKDQSYFLWGIDKSVLKHVILPLQDYNDKNEIRQLAKKAGLSIESKKDSQEICFIPNDDYKTFLDDYSNNTADAGDICLEDGTIIGKHNGLRYYTIGQRKGLNISYKEALYVVEIDVLNNRLVVGPNSSLFSSKLIAKDVNLLVDELPNILFAKVRSRGVLKPCDVEIIDENKMIIKLNDAERAITLGQSVVLYGDDNCCLGGGIIEKVLK